MASSVQSSRVSPRGYCSCCRVFNMWCWRAFKWLPVLVIVSIVAWSYYAYVVQLCISKIDSTLQQCVYLVIYHVVLIMFIWAYGQTVFASILPIPDKYKLPQTELEKLLSAETEDGQRSILENFAKDLPIVTRLRIIFRKYFWRIFRSTKGKEILETYAHTINVLTRTMSGSVRYCNRCVLIKPDRAHHCSICGTCVLKMDHHCPWVNNCVCYHNYKFFILFLGYALAYCLFVMFTTLPHFIKFWKMYEGYKRAHCDRLLENGTFSELCMEIVNGDFGAESSDGRYHIVFAFFVSLMFSISLGSLFGYHCYLVANNRTTLDFLSNRKLGSATGQIVNSMLISMVNEAFRAPMFRGGADKNGFSLGAFNNFKEVFGISPGLWLIPVFTSLGDGAEFPVRREHQLQTFTTTQDAHGYESMGITRSSLGDAFVYTVPRQDEESESLLSSEQWERWGERSRPFDERGSSSLDEL